MGWPIIELTEEGMREGMQIESAAIPVAAKIDLLNALSETGLKRIVVGSFVSPKYTPQMAEIEKIIESFTPKKGVVYTACILNQKGLERARAFSPPLTIERSIPHVFMHMCDVFAQRNFNLTQQGEIAKWAGILASAKNEGATEAAIGLGAAWGSNFTGGSTQDERMATLEREHDVCSKAGFRITKLFFADPMSWNMPHLVESDLEKILRKWPDIKRVHLHLHNARGMGLTSIYAAMRVLDERYTLQLDSTLGGMGGCPYCGNGAVTRMAPTEDLVHMFGEMGIDTGVDMDRLIRTVWMAEEIVGHKLWGAVSKAGPFPRGKRLYPVDLPFVQSEDEARHFMLGSEVIGADAVRPWSSAIRSSQRDRIDALTDSENKPQQDTKPAVRGVA
jgi:hydroxymethylglutaryl-CoA lyase